MGQALYRTYRSKKLSEVVGQEHITQALETALQKGLISHAYLFTGPRGVGKTSIARILAHEINSLPYTDDSTHLDIIEIDAASNRRIDEIRDLRDKVHIAPTSAKYKVYIIDEVHMLTREAFNALLKTLEEPPAHVVFILATTEVHKLPETIISRTQRYTFRPGSLEQVAKHLKNIAAKEKLTIDDDALALIARYGGGSFRDSIGILDQMRSLGKAVSLQDVEALLGIASSQLILEVLEAAENHSPSVVIAGLQQLQDQGVTPAQTAKQLGEVLRERFIANETVLEHTQAIDLLAKLLEIPAASQPAASLELALLDIALDGRDRPTAAMSGVPSTIPTPPSAPSTSPKQDTSPRRTAEPTKLKVAKHTVSSGPTTSGSSHSSSATKVIETDSLSKAISDDTLDAAIWPQVVNTVKKRYNTLYSILRAAKPHFEAGKVTLEVSFAFHQKRLNENRNKQIIADTIEQISGLALQVTCIVGKGLSAAEQTPLAADGEVTHTVDAASDAVAAITDKPSPTEAAGDKDYYVNQAEKASQRPVDTVSNIFGSAEVLES